jgi:hypothetical protein
LKEVKLPSGAVLKITPAPFVAAKALYQAVLKELRGIPMNTNTDVAALYKDVFCAGASSKEIEACVWECLKKCLYCVDGVDNRILPEVFEPVKAREDYTTICLEVAKENISPFVKSLLSEFGPILTSLKKDRK